MQSMPMGGLNNGDICDSDAPGMNGQAMELVRTLKVMTLATGSDQGCWSAPVFFFYRPGGFYFFSSPTSRHIGEAGALDGLCGASLFHDTESINELRGVQMQGVIELLTMTPETLGAAGGYVKKFGMQVTGDNVLAAITSHYRAKFYRFVPQETYYMDNRLGFGSRIKVNL
ncbi:FMN-binding pyridoxamine 5'-phosphate oxidase-related protein [Desulforapulum autotrophicum HRM2]|uniref:FMN-binding pyridoxamine 5'-phosphate oxidase-related protein n=1 Tax=Desulforapulum autotrophicum (strain ATCC 43914 / DSM 3382 / VKM B-1955 / HRM2) TaxID=177437 RepID=C0QJF3_DESAH|nr:pyridoxamine 5'-phosphate oxidase family protein [Desulforapulum autotrophicum]ACN15966.1 FMN-binding pyridoxamine 5'-phosphate oxidase-related protein [Desulforapulum autotrophicum HRM2]